MPNPGEQPDIPPQPNQATGFAPQSPGTIPYPTSSGIATDGSVDTYIETDGFLDEPLQGVRDELVSEIQNTAIQSGTWHEGLLLPFYSPQEIATIWAWWDTTQSPLFEIATAQDPASGTTVQGGWRYPGGVIPLYDSDRAAAIIAVTAWGAEKDNPGSGQQAAQTAAQDYFATNPTGTTAPVVIPPAVQAAVTTAIQSAQQPTTAAGVVSVASTGLAVDVVSPPISVLPVATLDNPTGLPAGTVAAPPIVSPTTGQSSKHVLVRTGWAGLTFGRRRRTV